MTWRSHLHYPFAGQHIGEVQQNVPRHVKMRGEAAGVNTKPVILYTDLHYHHGSPYKVMHHYYLPDTPPNEEDVYAKRHKIITTLNNRLDTCALIDRSNAFTIEEIDMLQQTYEECLRSKAERGASDRQQFYGSQLVLGMIDLMERIDRTLMNHHDMKNQKQPSMILSTSRLGKITDEYNHKKERETDEQWRKRQKDMRTQLHDRLRSLYDRLNDTELVSQVRRQSPIRHRDEISPFPADFDLTGVFSDMIREVNKASGLPRDKGDRDKEEQSIQTLNEFIDHSNEEKIGVALSCIDAIKARLQITYRGAAPFDESNIQPMLDLLADTARCVVSTHGYDLHDANIAEAQFQHLNKRMEAEIQRIRKEPLPETSKLRKRDIGRIANTLEFGLDLITDMVRTQLPCSEVFWEEGQEPEGMPAKTPNKREKLEYPTDLQRMDVRSNMALFELYSSETIRQLAIRNPSHTPWSHRMRSDAIDIGRK